MDSAILIVALSMWEWYACLSSANTYEVREGVESADVSEQAVLSSRYR